MAQYPAKDLALVEQTWTLVKLGRRPFWDAETASYVERITRGALIGRYTDEALRHMIEWAREKVALDLGVPPWDC